MSISVSVIADGECIGFFDDISDFSSSSDLKTSIQEHLKPIDANYIEVEYMDPFTSKKVSMWYRKVTSKWYPTD